MKDTARQDTAPASMAEQNASASKASGQNTSDAASSAKGRDNASPNKTASPDTSIATLFPFFKPYTPRLAGGIAASVVARVCDLAPMAIVGPVMDIAARGDGTTSTYAMYGLLILLAFSGLATFQSSSDYLLGSMAQNIRHDLRMHIFEHVQAMDMGFLEHRRKGDLLSVISSDVDSLESFFAQTTVNMVRIVVALTGTFAYLAWLDWRLALVLAVPLPLALGVIKIFSTRVRPQYLKSRHAVGAFNSILENSLHGLPVMQAYNAEEHEADRLRDKSAQYRDTAISAARTRAWFIPLIYIVAGLSYAMLISIGGYMTTLPDGPSIGEYTTFVLMAMRLVVPIFGLGFIVNQIQQARAAATRIADILETSPAIADSPDSMPLTDRPECIELDRVSFGYEGRGETLKNVSLSVRRGEMLGIAGTTGAGKSTLVKLLLRFHDPRSGEVRINGAPLTKLKLASFRRHFGYVSQDPFIFHASVAENIRLGSPDATIEDIRRAATMAGADEFIDALPDGFDEIIGDRGERLSGGQRQRLSLTRALLRDPAILILDEATSAVDVLTEKLIQDKLQTLRKGRIIIAVAHRLSTIQTADNILVMQDGEAVEHGAFKELLARGGQFAALWAAQEPPTHSGMRQVQSA